MAPVRYSDFGAVGDGKTDDFDALIKAHAYANEHGLPVKADDDETYYLGPKNKTITIETDVDFGKARFIIDNRSLENVWSAVFNVSSRLKPFTLDNLSSLKRNQGKIDVKLPGPCIVTVTDKSVKRFIRYGGNQNKGKPQVDVFLVDADGNVDPNTPIIWDFDEVSEATALPIDTTTLTIRGGHFTTIVDTVPSTSYQRRDIDIRRSNVEVVGLTHLVQGEGEQGAPYRGFLYIVGCANVTVRDTILTGHKTFWMTGSAGYRVPYGSYDISVHRAINVSFINCTQTNDIRDSTYWGIMGTNFCKNLNLDGCKLSRFDAHMGVTNATIRNSEMGYMGIKATGFGTLTVENTTVYANDIVSFRDDFGSTWKGNLVIRNCTLVPNDRRGVVIIDGKNHGGHDFGYTCYMPEKITIDGLKIEDGKHMENYEGPAIFGDFNPKYSGKEPHAIVVPEEVILKNVTTASGMPLRLSDNPKMFKDVKVKEFPGITSSS